MVELRPVESDAITAAGYDADRRVLAVRYESGAVYEYFEVDRALYDELLANQPHPWSQVGERVKSHEFHQLE
ncbi:hypothetical protein GCM10022288_01690 [Gryllotalpicola kribbensis]|jgi:hypothetical protein|uniref:KTSC domain-containing protein n=1 Tax=Gryllotalpicola kribbensis TaxID=993084 RepID=A0ABP8AF77_9MICO